jgi:alginate O-acetyltransferase complex protein AlgI
MLFNSIAFLFFLPLVFFIYWFVANRSLKLQNVLLLTASYVFYGWWDYRFLSLIALSTFVDYFTGQFIHRATAEKRRKLWLTVSVAFNLGLLGFFKYYNFFTQSLIDAFSELGFTIDPWSLKIILPIGISFYTFQTMSYSIDIYRKQLEPTKDLIGFAAFVAFFPQLVAGPIERASNLLPQILKSRQFNYSQSVSGLKLILWGMFKKVAIADSLAKPVNDIFANHLEYSGGTLILGAVYFVFQIYCDFSGYSDIARGTAKLLGVELMINFSFPLFSQNIAEFWRRWHISLSSWLNDYLFMPLAIGFRDWEKRGVYLALFITFAISGLWHGAGWNFVIYGMIHGLYFIPIVFRKKRMGAISSQRSDGHPSINLKAIHKMVATFVLVGFSFIFFRAENLTHAFEFIGGLGISFPEMHRMAFPKYVLPLVLMELVILFPAWYKLLMSKRVLRYAAYSVLLIYIITATNDGSSFIYFQF